VVLRRKNYRPEHQLQNPPEEPLQRLSDEQNTEFMGAIKQVAANHRTLDFPIDLGGSPVMVSEVKQKMIEEMPKLNSPPF
jgi:hypothetical protein